LQMSRLIHPYRPTAARAVKVLASPTGLVFNSKSGYAANL
jgi:hypothetical protein